MSSMGSYRTDEGGLQGGSAEGRDIGLVVNGEPRRVTTGLSVAELVGVYGLANKPCAVEVNKALVPKSRHATTTLKDGDVVELVTLVGGG